MNLHCCFCLLSCLDASTGKAILLLLLAKLHYFSCMELQVLCKVLLFQLLYLLTELL
jgi:hypothetical protein